MLKGRGWLDAVSLWRNVSENEKKKKTHRIKEVILGNWLKGEEIIKSLNDSQMNNVMR